MFYKIFCMTHPNRGGHTQKNEKPDFRIRMNRDGSEKKITYIKPYKSFNYCFINFFCMTTPSRGTQRNKGRKFRDGFCLQFFQASRATNFDLLWVIAVSWDYDHWVLRRILCKSTNIYPSLRFVVFRGVWKYYWLDWDKLCTVWFSWPWWVMICTFQVNKSFKFSRQAVETLLVTSCESFVK